MMGLLRPYDFRPPLIDTKYIRAIDVKYNIIVFDVIDSTEPIIWRQSVSALASFLFNGSITFCNSVPDDARLTPVEISTQ